MKFKVTVSKSKHALKAEKIAVPVCISFLFAVLGEVHMWKTDDSMPTSLSSSFQSLGPYPSYSIALSVP